MDALGRSWFHFGFHVISHAFRLKIPFTPILIMSLGLQMSDMLSLLVSPSGLPKQWVLF
jgi:hypothetical protein